MSQIVVVGAGPIGRGTALRLARDGHEVTVVTRSGSGPDHPAIRRLALDATDAAALTAATRGADALVNAANPPYHRWPQEWPPLHAAMLEAATVTGATLVITSNLYGYGPVVGPMTECTPLAATGRKGRVRADMWIEAERRHAAGDLRVVEVRASDYFGPEVLDAAFGGRVVPRILDGRSVQLLGSPDAPHSWSYAPDVVEAIAHVALDERAWGRAWHAPCVPPRTQREMVDAFASVAGTGPVRIRLASPAMVRALGLIVPTMRGLNETNYQFAEPFVCDWSSAHVTFGLDATPFDEAVRSTIEWFAGRVAVPA